MLAGFAVGVAGAPLAAPEGLDGVGCLRPGVDGVTGRDGGAVGVSAGAAVSAVLAEGAACADAAGADAEAVAEAVAGAVVDVDPPAAAGSLFASSCFDLVATSTTAKAIASTPTPAPTITRAAGTRRVATCDERTSEALVCPMPDAAVAVSAGISPLDPEPTPARLGLLDRATRTMRSAWVRASGPPNGASAVASAPVSA